MSSFGNILKGVSRHVLDSAMTAATNRVNAIDIHNDVHEINGRSNIDDVAKYPVCCREGCLVLHGPIEPGGFFHKTSVYNIILHVPQSTKMFSLFRTDQKEVAQTMFILYKETFPVLVQCDLTICEKDKLERIAKKLRENQGWTAPHVAAALGFQNCLRHANLKDRLNEQEGGLLRTPILVAVANDNLPSIKILLDIGVRLDMKDLKENTIFHLAATQSLQILRILLDKVPISQMALLDHLNSEGFTPLHIACRTGNSEIVKSLMSSNADVRIPSPESGFPIHCAVKANSMTSVQELVNRDREQVNFKDLKEGGTPLHWANGPDTLIPLLDLGCDPNMTNDLGFAPLHIAARRGCLKSTLYLLCHGAFPDVKETTNGDTALHIASRLCSKEVMQALIVFGADVNITTSNEETARHLVCTSLRENKDEILYILSSVGAKRCHEKRQGHCIDGCIYNGILEGSSPVNFPNHQITNVLHDAMNLFSIQKEIQDRVAAAEPMETSCSGGDVDNASGDSPSTSPNHSTSNNLGSQIGGRLLCLDGGGIRGIVLTQMLLVMEQEFGVPVIEMFDWVAGTSTGGILALALACGKSVSEAQAIYLRLKDKVFVGERPYSATIMEEFLKKEFGPDKKMSSILKPRVMIMAALVDRRPVDLHIFRNYLSPLVLIGETEACIQDADNQYVWETAKVTGAAPSYFRLDHSQFIDGGLIANNPTLDALTELHQFSVVMKSLGDFKQELKLPTVVVSLGTGLQPKTDSNVSLLDITWPSGIMDAITKVPRLASLVNLLIDQATQTEGQVVERSRAWCSSLGVPFFRYSPQMSQTIELDEKDDIALVNLLWETRVYMMTNKAMIVELKNVLFKNKISTGI